MSISASLISALKKIQQASDHPEQRQQAVTYLHNLIHKSMTVHAQVSAEAKETVLIEDTLNGKDAEGLTPLMWAARLGLADVMPTLLTGNPPHVPGAELDAVDNNNRTVLHHAAEAGHLGAVKFLCQNEKALTLLETRDKSDCTPLYLSAGMHHPEVVRYLIQEQKANISTLIHTTGFSQSKSSIPLSAHVIHRGDESKVDETKIIACLEILHAAGADFNTPIFRESKDFYHGQVFSTIYPLSLAAERGYSKVLEFMLSKNTDVNAQNEESRQRCSMLECALINKSWPQITIEERMQVLQALLKANPATEKTIASAIKFAMNQAKSDDIKSINPLRALLRIPEFSASAYLCTNEFAYNAKFSNYIPMMQVFIEEKAVNQTMMNKALLSAAENNANEVIKLLCESKPKPDQDALDAALIQVLNPIYTYYECVTSLLQYGANPAVKNTVKDATIFSYAIRQGTYDKSMSALRSLLNLPQVKNSSDAQAIAREEAQKYQLDGLKSAHIVKVFAEFGIKVNAPSAFFAESRALQPMAPTADKNAKSLMLP
ncbi:MAG: ankyrin repeat domain-containing protein [Gammaproteobacteria bacterium]